MLVELPEPFDWELSTERFRAFGPDPANLWVEGRVHRVFDGREVAIGEARGGVEIEPGGAALVEPVRRFLGAPFDLDAFARFAASEPVLADIVAALRGLRPPLAPDPFEALVSSITAQQVSLQSAFAIRGRLIRRFGVEHDRAFAFPTRERLADAAPEELRELGFSARKAEYVVSLARAPLDLDALAELGDDEVKLVADGSSRDRGVDGRLVPRATPRPAGRLARGRPRLAEGRERVLPRGPRRLDRRGAGLRRAVLAVSQPDGSLPARRT